ncbi:hypothetical protein NQ315_006632 [Exocentrus adspersus]|uniref:Uncharacterized protein n=1 Tax=Exocentrus adspersus TaxID=1586481 RepID=A0AAV8VF38_9CUCU|nr:hypothetical protein NQ315_006632 [Exocentrus adspersus]
MFVLCRTFEEEKNPDSYCHNEDERALVGTSVIDEVKKDLEMEQKKTGRLITLMMNKFVAIKQQAPADLINAEHRKTRNRRIEEFLEREHNKLEFSEIVENPGLRSLAKLTLNSF